MKSIRRVVASAIAGLVVSAAGWMAFAQGGIGSVQHVEVWAYGTAPQAATEDLFVADEVVSEEVVETVKGGALHLKFVDGTELRLGSSSRLTLDSIVYDPNQGTGEFFVDLAPGAFRIITGAMASESFRLETPVAVIGIRGSDVEIGVADDGVTTVDVNKGIATIDPKAGEAGISEVQPDESAQVAVDGSVSPGGAVDDPGLQDSSAQRSRSKRGGTSDRDSGGD
jgi:ferric-dicitrate binding protein FerR (iron transport regulator)